MLKAFFKSAIVSFVISYFTKKAANKSSRNHRLGD